MLFKVYFCPARVSFSFCVFWLSDPGMETSIRSRCLTCRYVHPKRICRGPLAFRGGHAERPRQDVAFNVIVDDDNAGEVVVKFSPYF